MPAVNAGFEGIAWRTCLQILIAMKAHDFLSFLALLGILAMTAMAFTAPEKYGPLMPNVTKMSRQAYCIDGHCIVVSAFNRRKLYIPRSRLDDHIIERDVKRYHLHKAHDDQDAAAIHLYYRGEQAPTLSNSSFTSIHDVLADLLEQYGTPAQMATFENKPGIGDITVLDDHEQLVFLKGMLFE